MTTPGSGARPTDRNEAEPGDETLLGVRDEVAQRPTVVTRGAALGRYVVLDRLGAGGMGVVFAAYDPELDRKVAVKLLQASSPRSSKATAGRARLLREAQAMAKLSHPNVIAVYDVGTIGDDVFLAMEFIAGRTLRSCVVAKRDEGRSDWRETLRLYIEAGRGLAAAHAAGIVHRDFKPENVMVDEHSRVRVLDFGLARPARDSSGNSDDAATTSGPAELRLTATGAVMGTPFYMAPEQHRGDDVDERADQFSFCVALWEALYGERPYAGSSLPELARTVLHGEISDAPRGSGVPPWVRRALERGLATDPSARHASMADLLAELGRDPGARRRLLAVSTGLVAVSTAAVVAILFVSRPESPCRDLGAGLEAVWNDDARQRVRAAFVPLTDADGEATFERMATRLDAYAKEWSVARVEACEATRVRNEQSEQVLELRYACLDTRVYRVEALLDVFSSADKEVVFQAPSLVQQLPTVVDCSDIARLRSSVPTPSDPAVADAVQDLRRRLAHIDAVATTGHLDQVLEQLEVLIDEAHATGYRPFVGDALTVRGRIALFSGDDALAAASFEQAQLIGEAEGYDGLIVDTCLWMATLEATRNNDFARAHRHIARAKAVLERMGSPRVHKTHVLLATARVIAWERDDARAAEAYEAFLAEMKEGGRDNETVAIVAEGAYGHILGNLGRQEEAEQAITRALTRAREMLGRTHPEVGALLIYRARLLQVQRRPEESLEMFEEARKIYTKAYGEGTANVGAVLNDQGLVLARLGRFDEALAKLEAAAPILRGVYGERNVQYASVLANIGEALIDMGRAADAVPNLEHAVETRAKVFGKDDVMYASALGSLGDARLQVGRIQDAAAAYEESLRVMTLHFGEASGELVHAEVGLGDVALVSGQTDAAREHYAHAIAWVPEGLAHDSRRARARFGLAKIEAAAGNREAAIALAEEAREELLERPDAVRRREAIELWLDEAR